LGIPLFVLAGGRATRLGALSEQLPKYLMPVKNSSDLSNGNPSKESAFADIHLQWAYQQGFRDIILSVGYLAQQIVDYCGNGKKWGLNIQYVEDGATPLGTGGAVSKSLQFEYQYLAVTYGDTLLNFPVSECLERAVQNKVAACMTIYRNQVPGHICNVDLRGDWVYYNKKNPGQGWQYIDYGFSVLSRNFVEGFSKERPLDLAEPLCALSEQGQLQGYLCTDRFWEIGSPQALEEFRLNRNS
jgi:NDP-sugar pyrophosphorylase family protein